MRMNREKIVQYSNKIKEVASQYDNKIKEVVSAIKSTRGVISSEEVVSKVLRTLLLIYAIRVSIIHELKAMPSNVLSLDALIIRQTPFELSNFDNSIPIVVNSLKISLTI